MTRRGWAFGIGLGLAAAAAAVTIWVEWPAPARIELLHKGAGAEAVVIYHPSRDAGFADALSLALAAGLADGGLTVRRMTAGTPFPTDLPANALLVVVANTYWFQPDWPTGHLLGKARWPQRPVLGVIAGAGATGAAGATLREALAATGANVLDVTHFWRFRPNDEARPDADNHAVAMARARALGRATARTIRAVPG